MVAPKLMQQPGLTAAALESSARQLNPYVQSHANSPVAWQLLDDETIALAKRENKLIFLNIGFKAASADALADCRLTSIESFSHPECAALLNQDFVPVIIDREERPDIDTIYMNYVQAVNGAGGWPLNLFLTPELEPVFGGTYWPGPGARLKTGPEEEEGVDFLTILKKLTKVWQEQEARCRQEAREVLVKLREFAAEGTLGTRSTVQMSKIGLSSSSTAPVASAVLTEHLQPTKSSDADVSSELDLDQLEEAYSHIAGTFDPIYGGFGLAPKFTVPAKLSFLLRLPHYLSPVQDVVGPTECAHATEMALFTLRKISDGGLRDHVGGCGFSRYSITPDWSIPHFEKLTVDNALLLGLYLDAWLISNGDKDGAFYDVLIELADYFSSPPVRLPHGGFASSEAADSYYRRGDKEMREGAYNLWTRKEFDAVIGNDHEANIAATYWNIREHGNVEPDQDPNDEFMNQNIPRVLKEKGEIGRMFGVSTEEVDRVIKSAKRKLKAHREKERVRPELDDKVIAGWNGLVIGALSRTAAALRTIDPEKSGNYLGAAIQAADFVRSHLWDPQEKVLYRIYRGVRGHTKAFADDHAYLIEGLIDLYEATGEENCLLFADELQQTQINLFYDDLTPVSTTSPNTLPARSSCGAFYTTPDPTPHAILRLKDGMDTSIPATNAIGVSNLFRLGVTLGSETYPALARETINAFEAEVLQYPWLFPGLLSGVVSARLGGKIWAIVRDPAGNDGETTHKLLTKLYGEARGGLRNIFIIKTENDLVVQRNPPLADIVKQGPGAYIFDNGHFRPCTKTDVEY
ncbi:spermatogenesis-associated protein [Sodiomyces alkalinus F11]|uniref:Spermatogenesis-associated protein n=1 Tax=Sodiomyces alkalinus (strain CBS 110278 / VKM F-3762 / F11) TaxID=1314773 RepID=A0A3N2Q2Y8_SODAK|nr:spermatogenesis-associated protein [Sodiomyces alkalinus F11]ROT41038.1 spermatogenesis-associated protein [Sodiomyces alkalinus F11]